MWHSFPYDMEPHKPVQLMVSLGNLAHPDIVGDQYRLRTLGNQDNPIEIVTDAEG